MGNRKRIGGEFDVVSVYTAEGSIRTGSFELCGARPTPTA